MGPGTHEDTETSFWCVRSACVRGGVHRVKRQWPNTSRHRTPCQSHQRQWSSNFGAVHRARAVRAGFASNSARVQRVSLHDTSSNLVQSTEGSMTEDSTDLRRVGVTLSAPAVTLTCSTTATRLRQRMWAVVHEFAESAGYERLAKACKVSGGKGICHQDCVPRLFVACWDISMVAVARVENIALGARLSIWAGLPRAIAYVGPQNGRVGEGAV